MATKMSNNYKSCPLKKRPIVYLKEDEPEIATPKIMESPKPDWHHVVEEEQPQDLSLKRKASQVFEDYTLPAKREYVLNLSTTATRPAYYRPDSPAISVASDHSTNSSVMLSPKAEFDCSMEYQHPTAIHLRGLTAASAGYTTNPYQSAFVMAAGCNPMTALWHTYQGGSNTTNNTFPSPATTLGSPNFYNNSQLMLMTPPSSPGSDASSSSEPEDLSVRNDIPLPALFHLFDEAPTTVTGLSTSSSTSSSYSTVTPSSTATSSTALKHYRFKCDKCSKMYSTSMGLSKHQQFHCPAADCNQEKKQHACQHCGKSYTSIGALKMHIRTHTLPCKCPICGKAFSRPWLLQGHIRTHTGEKPFQCPDCPRSFADRSNLRAHQQTHVDIKKYACKVCHKSFSRMSLLNKHASSNCTITIA